MMMLIRAIPAMASHGHARLLIIECISPLFYPLLMCSSSRLPRKQCIIMRMRTWRKLSLALMARRSPNRPTDKQTEGRIVYELVNSAVNVGANP